MHKWPTPRVNEATVLGRSLSTNVAFSVSAAKTKILHVTKLKNASKTVMVMMASQKTKTVQKLFIWNQKTKVIARRSPAITDRFKNLISVSFLSKLFTLRCTYVILIDLSPKWLPPRGDWKLGSWNLFAIATKLSKMATSEIKWGQKWKNPQLSVFPRCAKPFWRKVYCIKVSNDML